VGGLTERTKDVETKPGTLPAADGPPIPPWDRVRVSASITWADSATGSDMAGTVTSAKQLGHNHPDPHQRRALANAARNSLLSA
jgi:hypothetical protein